MNLRSVGKFGERSDGGVKAVVQQEGRTGGRRMGADKTDGNGKERERRKRENMGLPKKEPHASQQVLLANARAHTHT